MNGVHVQHAPVKLQTSWPAQSQHCMKHASHGHALDGFTHQEDEVRQVCAAAVPLGKARFKRPSPIRSKIPNIACIPFSLVSDIGRIPSDDAENLEPTLS